MNIHIFSPYYPPHTGGLESHSEEFNKHLIANGATITVFTPQIPKNTPALEQQSDSMRIIRFPAYEIISNYPLPKYLPFFWTPAFWQSFRSLWNDHPDIVISRTRFFASSFIALLYAKIRHVPIVHIEHGSDFVKLSSSIKTAIAKLYDHTFGRIIFHFSDINISISHAVQKFVVKFDKRQSPIIYRGIDFDSIDDIMIDEAIRKKYSDKIIISTAARLYKWKGIEFSIEAIRNLPEEIRSKIIFLIIGDGEDFSRLQKLSDGFPIEMLGNVPREKVIALLKASDIYIHSSLPGGGLSTSLLEAMYCKCAVIATPNEGANEIIIHQKNGILLTDVNSSETQTAITKIIKHTSLQKEYAQAAHDIIRKEFSWKNSIKKYISILHSIVHE